MHGNSTIDKRLARLLAKVDKPGAKRTNRDFWREPSSHNEKVTGMERQLWLDATRPQRLARAAEAKEQRRIKALAVKRQQRRRFKAERRAEGQRQLEAMRRQEFEDYRREQRRKHPRPVT
jgi:hypothetical protein